MSNPTVTIQLSQDDARRLLTSLETTAWLAEECILPDEECEDDSSESESGALNYVERFIEELREELEKEVA